MLQITESARLKFKDSMQWLFNGDCRSMIEIPDDFVQCIVTSPPYWGLRKYAGEQDLIWGNHNGCNHEWNIKELTVEGGFSGGKTTSGIMTKEQAEKRDKGTSGVVNTSSCSLCGAWRGSLGLEPTPELFLKHIVEIMRECRRVLRPDGVLFLNIGDSYAGSGSPGGDFRNGKGGDDYLRSYNHKGDGLKPLDLVLMPQRLAIELQKDGWYVRSIIIWHKTNTMPESVNGWRWEQHRVKVAKEPETRTEAEKQSGMRAHSGYTITDSAEYIDCPGCPTCLPNDGLVLKKGSWRPTENHEYILMLTKTDNYYCDREAVMMEAVRPGDIQTLGARSLKEFTPDDPNYRNGSEQYGRTFQTNGSNLRSVWTFPSQSSDFNHFAAFPEKLPELCIRAATPEYGVCAVCGKPWARVTKSTRGEITEAMRVAGCSKDGKYTGQDTNNYFEGKAQSPSNTKRRILESMQEVIKTLGWRPTCKCKTELPPVPSIVLDPFNGTGRTMWVAKKLGRRSVGYDLAAEYCEMAIKRNRQGGLL